MLGYYFPGLNRRDGEREFSTIFILYSPCIHLPNISDRWCDKDNFMRKCILKIRKQVRILK